MSVFIKKAFNDLATLINDIESHYAYELYFKDIEKVKELVFFLDKENDNQKIIQYLDKIIPLILDFDLKQEVIKAREIALKKDTAIEYEEEIHSDRFSDKVSDLYEKIGPKITDVYNKLESILANTNLSYEIDIKEKESLIDKIKRKERDKRLGLRQKSYTSLSEVPDIVRAKLMFPKKISLENYEKLIRKIIPNNLITKIDLRSDLGFKNVVFLDLNIDGFPVEIQCMPTGGWQYKEHTDQMYREDRSKVKSDRRISLKDIKTDRIMNMLEKNIEKRDFEMKHKKKYPELYEGIDEGYALDKESMDFLIGLLRKYAK